MKKRRLIQLIALAMAAAGLALCLLDIANPYTPADRRGVALLAEGVCGAESAGDNIRWRFYDYGQLLISGKGAMQDWDYTAQTPWREQLEPAQVREVIFYGPIDRVGSYSFAGGGYSGLIRLIMTDTIEVIGESAFADCAALTEVKLPADLVMIKESAFSRCTSLEEISFPPGLLAVAQAAFSNCEALREIDLPDSLTDMGYAAFRECRSLERARLSQGLTELFGDIFNGCTSLQTVNIPAGVKRLWNNVFMNCPSLTEIELPEGLEEIHSTTFVGCTGLTRLTVPASMQYMGPGCLSSCPNLKTVTLLNGDTELDGAFNFASLLLIAPPGGRVQAYAEGEPDISFQPLS